MPAGASSALVDDYIWHMPFAQHPECNCNARGIFLSRFSVRIMAGYMPRQESEMTAGIEFAYPQVDAEHALICPSGNRTPRDDAQMLIPLGMTF